MNRLKFSSLVLGVFFTQFTLQGQCTLTIDSVVTTQVSCYGQSDGSITVYASGNTGAIQYSNGSGGDGIVPEVKFDAPADLSTAGGSGPTDRWWSPSSCNSGVYFQYSTQQGCPAGSALFTGGFSGFAGCFLRSPKINMNGIDQVSVQMDLTHSFSSGRPNDNLRFYVWVNGAYRSTPGLFTINGVSGNTLKFDQERTCEKTIVTVDLSAIDANSRQDFMFYIESACAYANCSPYMVSVDNINISQGQSYQVSQTFSGLAPGSYPITIKDASGCVARLSSPVLITAPDSVQPLVSLEGAVLSTGEYSAYQWFLDGNVIEGATEQQYIIAANGEYSVSVIDSNGCGGSSDEFTVLTTGLTCEDLGRDMKTMPNPFQDKVLLRWTASGTRLVELRNLSGQLLLSKISRNNSELIDTGLIAPGIYVLKVTEAGVHYSRMLVKSAD